MNRSKRSPSRFVVVATLLVLPVLWLATVLGGSVPVARGKMAAVPLTNQLNDGQKVAQEAALADSRVLALTDGRRTEVFGVLDLRGEHTPASAECATTLCYQVEIYNFDENAAVIAIVNPATGVVLDVFGQPGIQPGINKRLADLATQIAISAPEVIEILGYKPLKTDMAPVPAGLAGTTCTGGHLCVAPTFRVGEELLWVVVDLTTESIAGLEWTYLGPDEEQTAAPFIPTGCNTPGSVNRDGWSLNYNVSAGDGLRIHGITFNGVTVANSIKLMEWHARYNSGSGFEDSIGCGGGGGFQIFPFGQTQVLDLVDGGDIIGFEVVQDFRMSSWGSSCNYRYEQRIHFYNDGRFRVVSGAYGKGCGTTALYRPIVRVDMDVTATGNQSFATWNGADWSTHATEFWQLQAAPYTDNNYKWLISHNAGQGYYIEPGQGQFGDNGRGDDAYIYVTQHKPSEGDTDLGIIWDCCDLGHLNGPHLFVNSESIANQNLVLWYVPQMMTDVTVGDMYCWTVNTSETYPCFAGPMFIPKAYNSFTHSGPIELGETAVFTSSVAGQAPFTYTWDFGDGVGTDTVPNPSYQYPNSGTFTVTLTTTGANGESATTTQTILVEALVAPTASFTDNGPYVAVGAEATFTNTSIGASSYLWDFGDGNSSTAPNPTHVYDAPASYTVTMTATNVIGNDTAETVLQVGFAPQAGFSHDALATVGEVVQFTNESTGSDDLEYLWDFGDGFTSTAANPSHTYTTTGEYDVTLTTSNNWGEDSTMVLLVVGVGPTAAITPNGPAVVNQPIQLNHASTGTAELSFWWDLGDGATSGDESPSHSYAATGDYTVTLTVSNSWGTDTAEWLITVGDAAGDVTPADGGEVIGEGITLTVPAGGTADALTLLYTATDTDPSFAGYTYTGVSFNLSAFLNGSLLTPYNFEEAVAVVLDYEAADFDPATIMLVYWDGAEWVDAAETCAASPIRASAATELCATGDFALVGQPLVVITTYQQYLPLVIR
ncbi:MAG: PKD domain-containing protein [Chloroflexi bacterium]|nr:PKD domain-containing protein [Chloroflexota bacterium]